MAGWRVARSLDQLLAQFNARYPNRSKASDGSIGDAAHASRSSDHNPWYGPGIVTARDFTHDPAHGMDIARLSRELAATRDRRIKYIICNRQILDSRSNPWKWMPYNGSNPHDHHMHVSVMDNASCDDTTPWKLASFGNAPAPTPPPPTPVPVPPVPVNWISEEALMLPTLKEGDGVKGKGDRGRIHWWVVSAQALLNVRGVSKQVVQDGIFGPTTTAMIKELQTRNKLAADGVVGAVTWKWLLGNDAPDYA